MPPYKVKNRKTGQVVEFEWNEPRKPTAEEIKLKLQETQNRGSGRPATTTPYAPTVERPEGIKRDSPPVVHNPPAWDLGRRRKLPSGEIVSEPIVQAGTRGINEPLLPELPESRGDALSRFVYNNVVRPSSSFEGLGADFIGGKAISMVGGKIANVIRKTIDPYIKKMPFSIKNPTGAAGEVSHVTTNTTTNQSTARITQSRNARIPDSDDIIKLVPKVEVPTHINARPKGAAPNVRISAARNPTLQQAQALESGAVKPKTPSTTDNLPVVHPTRNITVKPELADGYIKRGYIATAKTPDGKIKLKPPKPPNQASNASSKSQDAAIGAQTGRPNAGKTVGGKQPPEPPNVNLPGDSGGAGGGPNKPESLGLIRQSLREARQLQAGADLSFPLRQGINMATRKEYWQSFKPMLKSAWSQEGYEKLMGKIADDVDYKDALESGVSFTNLKDDIFEHEEELRGKIVQKLPVIGRLVKGSNRAYTAFSNNLRLGAYKGYKSLAQKAGVDLDVPGMEANKRAIANFVNDATGRGDLGSMEKNAALMNDFFFSPKLIASRVRMLRRALDATANVMGGRNTGRGQIMDGVDPRIAKQLRKEAIRSMLGVGGIAGLTTGLYQLNPKATGEMDPRSSNFGKIKVGNATLDMTGGYQQYVRVAAQLATGSYKSTSTGQVEELTPGFGKRTRWEVGTDFVTNKFAPAASLIVEWMKGERFGGREFQMGPSLGKNISEFDPGAVGERLIPMIAMDLYELSQEDPELLATFGVPTVFGASSMVNKPRGRERRPREVRTPRVVVPR